MKSPIAVQRSRPYRHKAEQFITSVFHAHDGAQIDTFPHTLFVRLGADGKILCAVGTRFTHSGFFPAISERARSRKPSSESPAPRQSRSTIEAGG
ncbi:MULTISPECIES: thermostable hemolysin [Rhizobium]|uniref:thermostable hemolysin n=1 Tax=Rhizobium TaxID=379 RepID=UPI00115E27C5|nr:thermostable hemolysin [Rhizobium sp. L58/93]MBO9172135.1 thermostable hemolysin [Rhizobium sp. L245/93]QXZ88144.1 thermostable hemolysin [Rhizobium sp. K1/93]QXZ94318.1 thermostable hemolysin [Rhizobium sp. K15/93]QYA05790.1 thermostable hemolysin [Rhizobium sp. B21/90]TQX82732.1 hypothetical protein EQW76_27795 [Rhizobium sp. rho-13.1]TQY05567.1 hypothetical protein EQW74_27260 [Rhizobium sp. rho-1.1]